MHTVLHDVLHDARGNTAIEYALIAAFISVAIIAVLAVVGSNLDDVFQSIGTALKAIRHDD